MAMTHSTLLRVQSFVLNEGGYVRRVQDAGDCTIYAADLSLLSENGPCSIYMWQAVYRPIGLPMEVQY
jgi:hypothetical protein